MCRGMLQRREARRIREREGGSASGNATWVRDCRRAEGEGVEGKGSSSHHGVAFLVAVFEYLPRQKERSVDGEEEETCRDVELRLRPATGWHSVVCRDS